MYKRFATIEKVDSMGYGKTTMNFNIDYSIAGTMQKGEDLMKYNCPIYLIDQVTNYTGLNADNIEERGGKRVIFINGQMINYSVLKLLKWRQISELLTNNPNNESIRLDMKVKKYHTVLAPLLKSLSDWQDKNVTKFKIQYNKI